MKKTLLTLFGALALSFSAQAIDLTFMLDGKEIQEGETVSLACDITQEDDYVEVYWQPNLTLHSSFFTNEVTVTANCTSGQEIQLCPNQSCQNGTKVTVSGLSISTNSSIPLLFHFEGDFDTEADIPVVTTEFSAQIAGDDSSLKKFTLIMGSKATLTIVANPAEFAWNGSGFDYNVSGATPFALYTADGQQVLSTTIEGNGTLGASLPAGFYLYTIGSKSGKIYIK
ncbi:MAG: T9SS type A sorting domain-containing protein [Clostridium sp.]|nr:T9SS type A sorting domain-containing protein [Clostridium sp.]